MRDEALAQSMGSTPGRAVVSRRQAAISALVIDDDEFVCRTVAAQLKSVGLDEVVAVSDGFQAVQLLNQGGPYGLIVSDLSMTQFDGIQMLRLVAARQPQAAVLLMSSAGSKLLSSAEALAHSRGLRILGALSKPVGLEDLRGVVDRLKEKAGEASWKAAGPPPTAAELRAAINGEQLRVYVQPQLDARTGALHGVEALARWDSPRHGMVPPASFIALAENNGLIDGITESMMSKSLAACGAWRRAGLRTRISVNAPIRSLPSPGAMAWSRGSSPWRSPKAA